MKKLSLILLSSIICICSCKKEKNKANDFNNKNYRLGLWISIDKIDTLDFIDNTNLIRKGSIYEHQEYVYRIEGNNLFIKPTNSIEETKHAILTVEDNKVVLGNMYISNGFTDQSGTFIKEIKN